MIHILIFLFLIIFFVSISCWLVAASLMAEKTRMGVTVFVADVFGSDGAAALLSACSLVRRCSHQFVFLCVIVVYVVLEHSSSLCDQLQGPAR